MVTEYPRAWSNLANEALTMPFPRLLLTPPVTKMYRLFRPLARVSVEEEFGVDMSRIYGIQR
jgi:hypothetical protein|tara:strand:- start:266 stop:451 length:186 start_codon:yes stop_codon:yes gene_type:complete